MNNMLQKVAITTITTFMLNSTAYASTSIPLLKQQKVIQHQKVTQSVQQQKAMKKQFEQYVDDIAKEETNLKQLNKEIEQSNNDIYNLNMDISQLKSHIQSFESKIVIQEQNLKQNKEKLATTLKVIYTNKDDSILNLLFESDSFQSFSFHLEYFIRIANQIKTVSHDVNNQIHLLSTEKNNLKNQETQLLSLQSQLFQKKTDLDFNQKEERTLITSITAKKEKLNEQIKQQNVIINQMIDEENVLQEQIQKAQQIQNEEDILPNQNDSSSIVGNNVVDVAYKWLHSRGLGSINPVHYSMSYRQLNLATYGDCSSFTRRVLLDARKGDIGLNTSQQLSNPKGQYIENLHELQAGDLMYFGPSGSHQLGALLPDGRRVLVAHTAIYVGNQKMIDLSESIGTISLKDFSLNGNWYWYVENRFVGGRRF